MTMRPQSAQVAVNKLAGISNTQQNLAKTISGSNNNNSLGNSNTQSSNGQNVKNGLSSLSRQLRQKTAGVQIKRKKNQTSFSFYKDVCQKLNVNINNAISHGLKNDEMQINIDNLTSSDIEPFRILLRECDFSSIILTGNKEFNEEEFYQDHQEIMNKYSNTVSNVNNHFSNSMGTGNTFTMVSGYTSTSTERRAQNEQVYDNNNQDGYTGKTPLGNHNGQLGRNRFGDTSNKNYGLKDQNGGSKKFSSNAENNNSNKNTQSKSAKQKKNFSSQTQNIVQVMKSVGVNIAKISSSSVKLTCIRIINLNLKSESLAGICKGLQKSKSVKELYIQNCGLTSETIEKGMLEFMTEIKSLILLDLSFNKLDGQSGGLIGKLLSSHSKNRDEHIWLCGLRGEVPENDVNLEGICEVNLMGNLLTDKSIKDLCYFLQFDGWTRSVNLRYNRIGAEGLVELDKMLDNNENLISLDIRNNPGMNPNYNDYIKFGENIKLISKSIYDKLLRNIKIFKQKRDDMRRKQQEQLINNLQYDNNNQIFPPNTFPQTQDDAEFMIMALQHQQMHPEQNIQDHLLHAQQQQYLAQQYALIQQQQQQQQQNMIPQQQNFFHQNIQVQSDQNYQGHKSKQNSQTIQGHDIQNQQVNQNGQIVFNQQEQIHQNQNYQLGEEQYEEQEGDEYDQQEKQNGKEVHQDQQYDQETQEKNAEGDDDLDQQQLSLKEKQNFIFSEEFLDIQQQHFQELYGENEEFLNLPEEQQTELFQQFLTHQQEQYLTELQGEEQMEGVEEVQEEQYEEDEEEEQNHDNHFNEQQMYYQQNTDAPKQHSDPQGQHINQPPVSKQENQQLQEHAEEQENQDLTQQNQVNNNDQEEGEELIEEEEEQDEETIKQFMEQIYEELQLEQIVDKNYKILQSEYEKLNLMIKLNNCQVRLARAEKQNASTSANLNQQIQQLQIAAQQQNQQFQQQQIANSWSAIQPNTIDQDGNNMIMDPQSFLLGGGKQQQLGLNLNAQSNEPVEGEDMLNRIEGLMTELTRLMDNLETMQNNVTNNITCQLSNTTNTNNQTYQLLGSNPNFNFNNTFTNILGGSHNNSNILPRNVNSNFLNNLTQQTGIQQLPQSNNNTQIQQVSSTQSGQKQSKKNQPRQVAQQQYYQQQPQQILQHQQQQQLGQFEQQQQAQQNRKPKFNANNNSR